MIFLIVVLKSKCRTCLLFLALLTFSSGLDSRTLLGVECKLEVTEMSVLTFVIV
jgi:hypothetical protein